MTDQQMKMILDRFQEQARLLSEIATLMRDKATLDDLRWKTIKTTLEMHELHLRHLNGLGQEARKASIS